MIHAQPPLQVSLRGAESHKCKHFQQNLAMPETTSLDSRRLQSTEVFWRAQFLQAGFPANAHNG